MHADELLRGTYSGSSNSGGLCEGCECEQEEGASSNHSQNRREREREEGENERGTHCLGSKEEIPANSPCWNA